MMIGYPISAAAKKLGVSAGTLRRWDVSGILVARRGDNGYRYYEQNDLENACVDLKDERQVEKKPILHTEEYRCGKCMHEYKHRQLVSDIGADGAVKKTCPRCRNHGQIIKT